MTDKVGLANTRQRAVKIGIVVLGVLAMTALGLVVGRPLIGMLESPAAFQEWIAQKGAMGRLAFVGLMALQVVIAWLPGEPLEIGAGYAFGFWQGSLLCMVGIVLGSVFVFIMVRIFGWRIVGLFFPPEKIDAIPLFSNARRLTFLSFIIFMLPGTPKDLLTYCVGLTSMKLPAWLLIAGVARIPPVITSTLSGSALGEQQYGIAVVAIGVTLLLSLCGLLFYRHTVRQAREAASWRRRSMCCSRVPARCRRASSMPRRATASRMCPSRWMKTCAKCTASHANTHTFPFQRA